MYVECDIVQKRRRHKRLKKPFCAILNNIPDEINVLIENELMNCEKGLSLEQWYTLNNFVKSCN